MCGIVGYIGQTNAVPVIMQGLGKLEYRGYDSAGITIYKEKKINYFYGPHNHICHWSLLYIHTFI